MELLPAPPGFGGTSRLVSRWSVCVLCGERIALVGVMWSEGITSDPDEVANWVWCGPSRREEFRETSHDGWGQIWCDELQAVVHRAPPLDLSTPENVRSYLEAP